MSNQRPSLALAMKLMALIALNLAVLREAPVIPQSPPILFLLVALNLAIVDFVILGRPPGVFHYTFLAAGFTASVALTVFAELDLRRSGSLRVVDTVTGAYEAISGTRVRWNPEFHGYLAIIERCIRSSAGVLLAWAIGSSAARRAARRPPRANSAVRHVVPFIQGALIGLGVSMAATFLADTLGPGPPRPHSPGMLARLFAVAACSVAGGLAVAILENRRTAQAQAQAQATGASDSPP